MTEEQARSLRRSDLTALADFRLGPLFVSPARRLVEGPAGVRHVQPQVMMVFLSLAQQEGQVVTRRMLFQSCWGSAPVGDDSLNRTMREIRRILTAVGAAGTVVETVPQTGYRLVSSVAADGATERRKRAVESAYDCWRSGIPIPDVAEIAALEAELATGGGTARDWGIFALLLRKAAEYADADDCDSYVRRCQEAARRALQLDAGESQARVALAGLAPLFGNWENARRQLLDILSGDKDHVPARHDLAVLEMATGRPSAAAPLIDRLITEDGFAATFHYKRMYHLWTIGNVHGAEQAAAGALQLWPRHPAIWAARFWILIFTGRGDQGLRFVADRNSLPSMPERAAQFLMMTAKVAATLQAGKISPGELSRHVKRCVEVAALGPAQAVSSLMSLCALHAIDEAFDVARGYYLGQGQSAAPLRWNSDDPSITDQHRRITQPLFIPAAKRMREDGRFLPLCNDIGLTAYWDRSGLVPDFLASKEDASPSHQFDHG